MNESRLGNQIASRGFQVMMMLCGIFIAVVSAGFLCFGLSLGKLYVAVVVLIACPIPIGYGLYVVWSAVKRQRLFEHGVEISGRSLSFDEMEHYTLYSVEEYVNHIYIYSMTNMTFVPRADSSQPKLQMSWGAFFTSQSGLERFIGYIAESFKQRLVAKLKDEGKVAWTDRVSLEEEGLRYETRNSTNAVAPYEYLEISQSEGLWGKAITIKDNKNHQVVGKFQVTSPNYLSYLMLLDELRTERVAALSHQAQFWMLSR